MSRISICSGILALVAAHVAGSLVAHAATVVGQNGVTAVEYFNVFDPNLDRTVSGSEATITSGPIGGGAVTGSNLQRVVNRDDNRANSGGGRIQDATGVATQGFMQFQAAAPFSVGTVLSVQRVTENFDGPTPFTLRLGNATTLTTVQTGAGTVGTHPYQLTNFEKPMFNQDRVRIELGMDTFNAGTTTIADFQEVILFEDRLAPIPVTSITATTQTFGAIPGIYDFNGGTGNGSGGTWATTNDDAPSFLELDFGSDQRVDGLVLANFENIAVSADILDDTNTVIAQITMDSGSLGDILPIEFVTPVTTSSLRIEFDSEFAYGMREAIPLTQLEFVPIPEPSSLMLGLIGLSLLSLKRRGRR